MGICYNNINVERKSRNEFTLNKEFEEIKEPEKTDNKNLHKANSLNPKVKNTDINHDDGVKENIDKKPEKKINIHKNNNGNIPKKTSKNIPENKTKNNPIKSERKNNEKKKSYSNFDKNKNYYLICPKCKNNITNIENIDYDSKLNDFIITYTCKCQTPDDNKKDSYLINFITPITPSTEIKFNFISEENVNKIKKIANENQKEFEGYEIITKICNSYNITKKNISINGSVAPPADVNKKLVTKSNITDSNFNLSVFKSHYDKQTGNKKSIMCSKFQKIEGKEEEEYLEN